MGLTKEKLPIGIERFDEIRTGEFYYIDKTDFIRELLQSWRKVNLFLRPRRFGKTLMLDLVKSFFEIGMDPKLFQGLAILQEEELCRNNMGQFPVISINFKNVGGDSYESALKRMAISIRREARRFQFLLKSDRLTEIEKNALLPLFDPEMPEEIQQESLLILSEMLYKHYGKKVILLIDEYDVPLENSYMSGFYGKMSGHIRSMFQMALKTNEFLHFAILTGCMQITRESVFSGLNNLTIHTASDREFDRAFGFTEDEVRKLLADYGMEHKYEEVREWYSGYCFGNENIYCPWNVLNYIKDHAANPEQGARPYWASGSGNGLVREAIESSDGTWRSTIERLMSGEIVQTELVSQPAYYGLDVNAPSGRTKGLWEMLCTAGYLTDKENLNHGFRSLAIPNREVRTIFEQQIMAWTESLICADHEGAEAFCDAVRRGDTIAVRKKYDEFLRNLIGTEGPDGSGRAWYCGSVLSFLLKGRKQWRILSKKQLEDSLTEVIAEDLSEKTVYLFWVTGVEKGMNRTCRSLLQRMENLDYEEMLGTTRMKMVRIYAVACRKKECRVHTEKFRWRRKLVIEESVAPETEVLPDSFAVKKPSVLPDTIEMPPITEELIEESKEEQKREEEEPKEESKEETEESKEESKEETEESKEEPKEEAEESKEEPKEEAEEPKEEPKEETEESKEEPKEEAEEEPKEEPKEEAEEPTEEQKGETEEPKRKQIGRTSLYRVIGAVVLLLISAGLLISSRMFPVVADVYANMVYPFVSTGIGSVTGLVPFSVAEILIYGGILFLVFRILYRPVEDFIARKVLRDSRHIRRVKARQMQRYYRKDKGGNRVFSMFSWILLLISVLGFLYTIGCGVNYQRTSFAQESGIDASGYSTEELKATCSWLTQEVNKRARNVSRTEDGIMQAASMEASGGIFSMTLLSERYPTLSGYYPTPKKLIVSEILSYQGLSGVFSPFTIEANYNGDLTPSDIPFAICHELAHLKGYMQEEEANFIAFLACTGSKREDFNYSGYLVGWKYCMKALYRSDRAAWEELQSHLVPEAEADLKAGELFWEQYDGGVARLADKVNDTYLKANGQADGVGSYDRVADLIIAAYMER